MIYVVATLLLLAGLSQQQSTEDLNKYVDDVLKELPSLKKYFDPLTEPAFSFRFKDHPHYGHVKFEPSTVTGLSTVQRSGDCGDYTRFFPKRVYVGCNVTFGEIKVHVKSQLKYDRNTTTVEATSTFPEVHGRLYVSVGAWKGPRARVYPKLGNFTTEFTGLDETPETQRLRWGYYEVIRDLLAVGVERAVSLVVGVSAGKVLWPCC